MKKINHSSRWISVCLVIHVLHSINDRHYRSRSMHEILLLFLSFVLEFFDNIIFDAIGATTPESRRRPLVTAAQLALEPFDGDGGGGTRGPSDDGRAVWGTGERTARRRGTETMLSIQLRRSATRWTILSGVRAVCSEVLPKTNVVEEGRHVRATLSSPKIFEKVYIHYVLYYVGGAAVGTVWWRPL